jgi:urate oxidase
MPHKVWTQSYGKSRVRLTKVYRDTPVHEIVELSVDVELDGDFDASYTKGDNARVIPTDTMKNTVYAFARELDVREVETFAWTLGSHFVENFEHVSQAMVKVTERPWERLAAGGKEHPHAFLGSSTERNTCQALVNRTGEGEPEGTIECGLEGLVLLKTTESGFSKFARDEFTTLKETDDRIFATTVTAGWSYNDTPDDWRGIRRRIRGTLIHEFAARRRRSRKSACRCQICIGTWSTCRRSTSTTPTCYSYRRTSRMGALRRASVGSGTKVTTATNVQGSIRRCRTAGWPR